eukprot:scaffold44864_cov221-Amphora_coffeaeformis.AAC.1
MVLVRSTMLMLIIVLRMSILLAWKQTSGTTMAFFLNRRTVSTTTTSHRHHHRRRRHNTALSDARLPILQRALERMQILQTQCCLPNAKVASVHVDASSIPNAGKGLFASKNIQAGTIVSFYPVHAIGMDNEDRGDTLYLSAKDGDGISLGNAQDYSLDYIQYLVGSRPLGETAMGAGLFVDANPSKKDDADGWLSHYINDGATVLSNTDQGILDYYAASRRHKNCVQVPFGPSPVLATVTTRKVKKGQELFTSYGCFYWLETILMPGEECTDINESALIQAKETAQDLFQAMQSCRTKYKEQEEQLCQVFYGISSS